MLSRIFALALIISSISFAQDRPLRYHPDVGDFVIDNGTANFNRPLYTAHTPGRVDAGDRPEFAFCFPQKGGVLRLGIQSSAGAKWLIHADDITTRYRAGSQIYEITDSILGTAKLEITALPTQTTAGLVLRAKFDGQTDAELFWAYGGGTGENNRNHFDLGGSKDLGPIWNLHPSDCDGATVDLHQPTFIYTAKVGSMICTGPNGSQLSTGDANLWGSPDQLLKSTAGNEPIAIGQIKLSGEQFIAIEHSKDASLDPPALFAESEKYRAAIASQVTIDTPDEFINAIPGAMCIAADDIWQPPTFMHGANAWRTPLLGWRGPYALDVLGWHDRAATQFTYWASRQNVDATDVPTVAHADPAKNLAANDWKMLHSFGNIPQIHYDMDLAFIDELYWHFLWTGDVDFLKKMWPTIVRHLAWEKRCFDRDGLYEAYACIWASDALEYNGGGAAHSTAYNYLHNLLAAKMAKVIGEDPTPYEKESARILDAMNKRLWMPQRGWYGEYQDLLGLQRVHPDAAVWSIYHPIDSQVPDPFQAFQMLRYVTTEIPHVNVGDGCTIATSDWQPYQWSLNNVCLAESAHTALAYWQSGENAEAYKLFRGSILDAMYMGLCPGDLPNLSFYDVNRGESYRDFGDTTGSVSRAFIQGLFGIVPDAIAGELTIRPGFPADWQHVSIQMADVEYSYERNGDEDRFVIQPKFPKPMSLKLIWPARTDHVTVQINGQPATWENVPDAVGVPRVQIVAPPAERFDVIIGYSGDAPAAMSSEQTVSLGDKIHFDFAPANLSDLFDPQKILGSAAKSQSSLDAIAGGLPGHRTAFAKLQQGDLIWWMPLELEIRDSELPPVTEISGDYQTVDLSATFNDRVTRIFQNDYLSPRSPYCSLQIPKDGFGEWTGPTIAPPKINDAGLGDGNLKMSSIPFHAGPAGQKNIAFTSIWDNYPHEISVPLTGHAKGLYLLLTGSTNPMETQIDNAELIVTYQDNTTKRLGLMNPTNWWPIEQDYPQNDFSFRRISPLPTRLRLATGEFYTPGKGGKIDGGAATVIIIPLDAGKNLKSLTLRALSNTTVEGLMAVTMVR